MSGDGRSDPETPWHRALARFEAAVGELRRFEAHCSGRGFAEQEALQGGYDERLGAMSAALRRAMRVRAPDLPALAAKIELALDQEVWALSGGELCLAALRRDVRRLIG